MQALGYPQVNEIAITDVTVNIATGRCEIMNEPSEASTASTDGFIPHGPAFEASKKTY